MTEFQEKVAVQVRGEIIEAIESLEDFIRGSGVHSPRITHALALLDCAAIDFERLVKTLSAEAKS